MSTRAVILLGNDPVPKFIPTHVADAVVYKHCDGYPNSPYGMLATLDKFFGAIESESARDNRYDDPSYLAARLIVFLSQYKVLTAKAGPATPKFSATVAFASVGVLGNSFDDIPTDLQWVYYLACTDDKRPVLYYMEYSKYAAQFLR